MDVLTQHWNTSSLNLIETRQSVVPRRTIDELPEAAPSSLPKAGSPPYVQTKQSIRIIRKNLNISTLVKPNNLTSRSRSSRFTVVWSVGLS